MLGMFRKNDRILKMETTQILIVIITLIISNTILFFRMRFYKSEYRHISISYCFTREFIVKRNLEKDWKKYINKIGEKENV